MLSVNRIMHGLWISLLMFVLAGAVSGEDTQRVLIDGVAARANEHVITVSEAKAVMASEANRLGSLYSGDELREKLNEAFTKAVESLVNRFLILDAYKAKGMQMPDWVVDRRIEEIVRDKFEDNYKSLMNELEQAHMTLADWRKEVLNSMIVSSMRSLNVHQDATVSPSDVKAEYESHLAEYSVPAQVKLSMIVLDRATDTPRKGYTFDEAVALRKKLDEGESFASIAKKLSVGVHSKDGGDWGWTDPSVLRQDLKDQIEKLNVNEISQPLEIANNIYIISITGKEVATVKSLDEVYDKIRSKLEYQKADESYKIWINRLRSDAYVVIYQKKAF